MQALSGQENELKMDAFSTRQIRSEGVTQARFFHAHMELALLAGKKKLGMVREHKGVMQYVA